MSIVRKFVRALNAALESSDRQAMPRDEIDQIRARNAVPWKGSEFVAWYSRDVPLLLDEIDRLRYLLDTRAAPARSVGRGKREDRSS